MTLPTGRSAGSLRIGGTTIGLGLCVQAVTFHWNHPFSFVTFALLGVVPVIAGVALALRGLRRR